MAVAVEAAVAGLLRLDKRSSINKMTVTFKVTVIFYLLDENPAPRFSLFVITARAEIGDSLLDLFGTLT